VHWRFIVGWNLNRSVTLITLSDQSCRNAFFADSQSAAEQLLMQLLEDKYRIGRLLLV